MAFLTCKIAQNDTRLKLITICTTAIILSGCAAGRMFMAGYQPPQTIADLLNEQYAIAGEEIPLTLSEDLSRVGIDIGELKGISTLKAKQMLEAAQKGQNAASVLTTNDSGQKMLPQKYSDRLIDVESYKSVRGDNKHTLRASAGLMKAPAQRFAPLYTYKGVQDYAGQLAMELVKNANSLTKGAKIGVTSFVRLDESLQTTTVLGNQMAEYAMSEIQQLGLTVIDFKTMPAIQVTSKGELTFSRDLTQLVNNSVMNHILSATMIDKADGVFINARIIEMKSNRVVSSASVLIPNFISQQIHPQYVSYNSPYNSQ